MVASHVLVVTSQPSPVMQSLVSLHFLPTPQGGQVPPPQSTSVSVPFWMPSLHEAGTHMPVALHTVPPLSAQAVPAVASV